MARMHAPSPLDAAALRALALHYVARYATTAAKLQRYLARKLAERGWDGAAAADVPALIAQLQALGYVDDRSFGEARVRGLAAKGYGARRVSAALGAAGIAADLAAELAAAPDADAAARTYARRRRFGPWDSAAPDPLRRQKQFAAMLRAGHRPEAARRALEGEAED